MHFVPILLDPGFASSPRGAESFHDGPATFWSIPPWLPFVGAEGEGSRPKSGAAGLALAGRAERGRDPPEGTLWVVAGGGACLDASPGATNILAVEGWTSYSRRSRHDRAEGRPYAGGCWGVQSPNCCGRLSVVVGALQGDL